MDDRKHSISPDILYARLGSDAAPIIVDVRRDADFAGAETLLADAFHRSRTPSNNGKPICRAGARSSPTAFTDVKSAKAWPLHCASWGATRTSWKAALRT